MAVNIMKQSGTDDALALLRARVLELAQKADTRYEITHGVFYNSREAYHAAAALTSAGYRGRFVLWGGYPNAERRRAFVLPEHMSLKTESDPDIAGLYPGDLGSSPLPEQYMEAASFAITPLRVDGSGYRTLSHRDFLGAILALGIKRTVIGDIIVDSDGAGAVVIADSKIASFISSELKRIGSDTVKTYISPLPDGFSGGRRTERIIAPVSSLRADCVAAALTKLSRERAKELIMSGVVELNYETITKPDIIVEDGDILTIRGHGKFIIGDIDGTTRRGRLRLCADRYI
jgi:RNA-binding protein YlmH